MRKVKFKKFIPAEYIELESRNQAVKEGTGNFEKDFINEGLFHGWGIDYEEFEDGIGNFSVALIEDDQGLIHEILPRNVKFKDQ